ncbi:MAG TPA: saccharopine dehydrogenase NADP-binding domain-containing protein [Reyranella sp.]
MTLRVLIVGGYGIFGGRIVELLKDDPRLALIVAGRSPERAKAFCARQHASATLVPAVFDRNGDLGPNLATLRPDLLVDASGPFQAYGQDRYRVIEACIAARVPYLDLADGADFVDGVQSLDTAARTAGVFVLSGVSSFPVLTAAATRRLAAGLARVDAIRAGIAPSPYAIVGENVIRAITGYAGQPTRLRRNGQTVTAYPFTEQMRFTVAPPGRVPLRSTLFSLVEVPDLRVLAALWPKARTVWMGAGPVPELLHRVLIALAWMVRWRILPSLLPLTPLIHWASNHVDWGAHRGGMFVEVDGVDGVERMVTCSWHLLAEGDDGPLIPSMAVEGIVRRLLDGQRPDPGARAAVRELELEDYDRLFARRMIHTGFRN